MVKIERINTTNALRVFDNSDEWEVLISYSTPVALYTQENGVSITSKYYSVTTTKHIKKWLTSKGIDMKEANTTDPDSIHEFLLKKLARDF